MDYIKSLSNTFEWVNNVLQNNQSLTAPAKFVKSSTIPTPNSITDPVDWITVSKSQLFALTSAYRNLDFNYQQAQNIVNQNNSEIVQLTQTIQNLQSKYLSLKNNASTNSKVVSMYGGDLTNVDTDEKLYYTNTLLESDAEQGLYTLPNTGVVSGIRSRLGANAFFKLEKTNAPYVQEGQPSNIVDGSDYSYWSIKASTPNLYYSLSPEFVWGASDHRDGFSCQGAIYFEKPVLISEILVKPVTTAPLVVSRISWTPFDLGTGFEDQFLTTSAWSNVTGTTSLIASGFDADIHVNTTLSYSGSITTYSVDTGVEYDNTDSTLEIPANTSFVGIKKTFLLSTLETNSKSTLSSDTYYSPNRLDIYLTLKGNGIPYQVKVNWIASGEILNSEILQNHTSSEYQTHHFPFYVPEEATSVEVEIGSLNNDYDGYLTLDSIKITLGENTFEPDKIIYRDTPITFPSNRITTHRVSVTLTQKNPEYNEITGLFDYSIGLKELDVRYKEYYPRASLISKKIEPVNEIRQFSTTLELSDNIKTGVKLIVFPYEDDLSYQVIATPKIIYNTELTSPSEIESGEVFSIFTNEEYDNGYTDDLGNLNLVLLSPKTKVETFDGTDRSGQVHLNYPVHFRKFQFEKIRTFLTNYGITLDFDPNMESVYGIADQVIRTNVLIGDSLAAEVDSADIIATDGYVPLRVTVQNDNFTAIPDINGKPRDVLVYTVTNESLTEISSTMVDTTTVESYLGYDIWLANTKLKELVLYGYITSNQIKDNSLSLPFRLPDSSEELTIKQCIDYDPNSVRNTTLFSWYTSMVTNKQIKKLTNNQTVETHIVETTSYQTKHYPIVNGSQGCALVVYLDGVRLASNTYKINPSLGIIKFLKPVSGVLTVSYSYIVKPYSLTDQDWFTTSLSNNLIVTRNKTNYETGVAPELKPFDPDPTSNTYYPIIEYYLSSDNKIVFSREFFKYGSLPSKIIVEYDTLAIKPRLGVFVERLVNATTTPKIMSASLEYNDAGAAFIK